MNEESVRILLVMGVQIVKDEGYEDLRDSIVRSGFDQRGRVHEEEPKVAIDSCGSY